MSQACYGGPAGTAGVGLCRGGTQTCNAGVFGACNGEVRPAAETCNNADQDCDGRTDEQVSQACYGGPAGTAGVGTCRSGTQACAAGVFGACNGEVRPTVETCDNTDQDCDSRTDEAISRSCYSGPAGTAGVGTCRSGTQACAAGAFGACNGQVVPVAEFCDALDNDCDGTPDDLRPSFVEARYPADLGCFDLAIGDLNRDGRPDIVCAPTLSAGVNPDTRIAYWLNTGNGLYGAVRYTAPVAVSPFRQPSDVALADIDGDGDVDLVATGETMKVQVYRNNNGVLAAPVDAFDFAAPGEHGTLGLALTDLNGDGRVDIATSIGSVRTADWRLAVANGNGNGTFAAPREFGVIGRAIDLVAGDVDADGDIDLIVWSAPSILLFRAQAGGFAAPVSLFDVVGDGFDLGFADLTGDGRRDLVVPGNGTWAFARAVGNSFAAPVRVAHPVVLPSATTGDFDCDAGVELVLVPQNDGAALLFVGDPATQSGAYTSGQYPGYDIEAVDVDADGLDDLVITSLTSGVVVLRQQP